MMEEMVQALQGSFKSERLVYRPMDDSDKEFIHAANFGQALSAGLSNAAILQPISQKHSDERVDAIIKGSMLAVVILVPGRQFTQHSEPSYERAGFVTLSKESGVYSFRQTSVGLTIADKFQGKGYGREALKWALRWCFAYANMHRVEIGTIEYNERAIGLYKSVGFVEEGRARKSSFFNGTWYDNVHLSMIEDEYWELKKSNKLD